MSKAEKEANQFDRLLYNPILRAAGNRSQVPHREEYNKWGKVQDALQSVRPVVRGMMNRADRDATSGNQ